MKRIIIVFIGFAVFSVFAHGCKNHPERNAIMTSIIHLLAHPERYVDEYVSVYGYLDKTLSFSLTKEYAKAVGSMASLGVNDTSEGGITYSGCTEYFVQITGKFVKLDTEFYGLTDVREVYKPGEGICWQRDDA